MLKKYWIIKSEPDIFSIYDLAKCEDETTFWDGVRNYQARNYMRDEMKIGDLVLFYHSNTNPNSVVGICQVVKEGYPDFTAFDSNCPHYDPKSRIEKPTWIMVDVKLIKVFSSPVSLSDIRANKKLSHIKLLQTGNRLSVMPILKEEFEEIVAMSNK